MTDRQHFDNAGVLQGHADPAFAKKEVDLLRIFGPAATQDLDGDGASGLGIIGPKDPAMEGDAASGTGEGTPLPEPLHPPR